GGGLLTLTNVNTFTGNLLVNAGTISVASDLNLGQTNATPTAGRLVLNGGTVLITNVITINPNRGISLGPTSGSGSGSFDVVTGATNTYSGILANNGAGIGGLNKLRFGGLILFGTNSYTGPTAVSNGVLFLDFSRTN